ncbi:MAG: SPOR domain-containing protein [Hyphomicrobium sp.]
MTKPAIEKTARRKASPQPNSVIWAAIGAVGLGYLGVAFFAPQFLPDLSGGRAHLSESSVLKMSADVDSLKSSLTRLELDVSSVKSEVAAQATQTQTLSTQLTELDDKVRLAQAPASASATAAAQVAQDASQSGTDAGPADPADAGPAPAKVINAPRVGAPIETGSVKTKTDQPISFGPAVVKPAPHIIGIQLATDPSVDGLRVTWGALSQIHADQLGQLKARYADIGTATSPNFGLIAGPIKSKAEARKICKELAAQSVSCKVSDFKGEEL